MADDTFKADLDAAVAEVEAAHDAIPPLATALDAANAAVAAANQAASDASTALTAGHNRISDGVAKVKDILAGA